MEIAGALRSLAPTGTGVAALAVDEECPALFPEEEASISRAVARRRREFTAGRACARQALAELGLGPKAIPVGPNRAPVWPEGVVGSITHAGTLAAAAVARSDRVIALGIDIESNAPLPDDLRGMVLTPHERHPPSISASASFDAGQVIFSAKETIHKCIDPLTGVTLGFLDVHVEIAADGAFQAGLERPDPRVGALVDRIRGRVMATPTHVLAVAAIRR